MATNQQMIDRIWSEISTGLDISAIDYIYVKFALPLKTHQENTFYFDNGVAGASYNSQKTLREHYKIICDETSLISFATMVEYLPGLKSQDSLSKAD